MHASASLQTIHHYFYAGQIERGTRYAWRDGYAKVTPENHVTYPWLTIREAQKQAKSEGALAMFHETQDAAYAALSAAKPTPRPPHGATTPALGFSADKGADTP